MKNDEWDEAQNLVLETINHLKSLAALYPHVDDQALDESILAVLNRALKKAHDLEIAIYRAKNVVAVDLVSIFE